MMTLLKKYKTMFGMFFMVVISGDELLSCITSKIGAKS